MVIIAVFCGVLSILISCIAVYQSEHFNKLSRELNKDTMLMIDCNEKSINNLHSTLEEIINKEETKSEIIEEELTFIKNEIVLAKQRFIFLIFIPPFYLYLQIIYLVIL